MSPRRVQDPKGAKIIALRHNSPAGAIAAITKRRFLITCYTEHDTSRLRLDLVLTPDITLGARICAKKILIYDALIHPLSHLDPKNCGTVVDLSIVHMGDQHPQGHGAIPGSHYYGPGRNTKDRGHKHTRKHAEANQGHGTTAHTRSHNDWHAAPGRHGKHHHPVRTYRKAGQAKEPRDQKYVHTAPQWTTPTSSTRTIPTDSNP